MKYCCLCRNLKYAAWIYRKWMVNICLPLSIYIYILKRQNPSFNRVTRLILRPFPRPLHYTSLIFCWYQIVGILWNNYPFKICWTKMSHSLTQPHIYTYFYAYIKKTDVFLVQYSSFFCKVVYLFCLSFLNIDRDQFFLVISTIFNVRKEKVSDQIVNIGMDNNNFLSYPWIWRLEKWSECLG